MDGIVEELLSTGTFLQVTSPNVMRIRPCKPLDVTVQVAGNGRTRVMALRLFGHFRIRI